MWNSGCILGQPSQGTDEFCWGPGTVLCTVPCIHDRAAEATGKVQYVLELKCFCGGKPLKQSLFTRSGHLGDYFNWK